MPKPRCVKTDALYKMGVIYRSPTVALAICQSHPARAALHPLKQARALSPAPFSVNRFAFVKKPERHLEIYPNNPENYLHSHPHSQK